MKIAVIGAGISGLSVAYWLSDKHSVTVLEKDARLGGHANTVDVEIDGERHAIDTGFIVFNDRTYPHFVALLHELGVVSRPSTMSFSVQCQRTGLEYNGSSFNGLFAQRRNLLTPCFHRMLLDIVRFNRHARRAITHANITEAPAELTVGDFIARGRYSQQFVEQYLLPLGSAIWSCPRGAFQQFPMAFVAEFFHNHGLLDLSDRPTWRVIEGGSRAYVDAMARRFRQSVRLATPVASVRRFADHVDVTCQNGSHERFDHVVFACHSDQALRMLADPSLTERELLGAFPYQRSLATLHTDTSLLPQCRSAWASWNYLIPVEDDSHATLTYCMNILQGLRSKHVFNVTLNCDTNIDPAKILGQFTYEHPVFNTGRTRAQARHHELLNVNRSSFCGAYWRNGFHEDGLVSGLAVCRALGTEPAKSAQATVRSEQIYAHVDDPIEWHLDNGVVRNA